MMEDNSVFGIPKSKIIAKTLVERTYYFCFYYIFVENKHLIFMRMITYIAYYRVSTKRQSLGIEAQRSMVATYIKSNGGKLVASYEEKESGKNDNRPQLNAALAECKRTGATLLIAKLDRLSRKVSFVFQLKDSGVRFVATDLPQFNTMTLAVFCGLAQQEREMISQRTKDALASRYEKEGWAVSHGNSHKFDDECRKQSLAIRKENAVTNEYNRRAYAAIKLGLNSGIGYKELASYLNENNFTTAKGGVWRGNQVKRLIELYQ